MARDRPRDESVVAALRRRLRPSDAITLNNLAWFAARRGATVIALESARAAIALPGAPPAAWRALERLAAGRSDGMLLVADGPVTATPTAIHPLAAALSAHQHGDLPVAEACYRAALHAGGHDAAAWNGLAVLHEQRRERVAADEAWQSVRAEPHPAAIHNRALAMLRRGFPHRARAALAEHTITGELTAALSYLAGYAALSDQDPAAAMPLLLAAVHADPHLARAHFTLGLACERLRLHDNALRSIRQALLLSPAYQPQVWLLVAGDGLIHELPAVMAGDEHADEVLLSLGRSLLQMAHFGEALAVFDQVLTRQPSQTAALFHRGVVLAKLRRYGEALDDWEHVDRVDPDGVLARASRRHALSARQLAALFASA
jgi:tetratricopeptide (TPR) repeat protein